VLPQRGRSRALHASLIPSRFPRGVRPHCRASSKHPTCTPSAHRFTIIRVLQRTLYREVKEEFTPLRTLAVSDLFRVPDGEASRREAMGRAAEVVAPSSSIRIDGGCPVAQVNDLSRSLTAFDLISTLVVVVEMSKASWLVSGGRDPIRVQPNTSVVRAIDRGQWQAPLGSSRGQPPDRRQPAAVLASVKDKPSAALKRRP
jgi:hypothetical protein